MLKGGNVHVLEFSLSSSTGHSGSAAHHQKVEMQKYVNFKMDATTNEQNEVTITRDSRGGDFKYKYDMRDKVIMVFAFWMREIACVSNLLNEHLEGIIWRFYCMPQFRWNAYQGKGCVHTFGDGRGFAQYGQGETCMTSTALCVNSARWEVTLKRREGRMKGMDFMIGYGADSTADKPVVALHFSDGHHPRAIHNGWGKRIFLNWKITMKIGDRIRLDFDFRQRECWGFYNDQEIGLISRKLPDTIHPAVSVNLMHAHDVVSFETTMFDVN